ncbi:transcriptional regulator LytR [Terribacillus saccharophilus]|uniref:Transcriptional regulator LytR n=1 Tax=Terribacillus saccharophilus TaxID=361277 RepID=A0A268HHK0_9BACI|nr:LCP family protein [Terribacillus saccharophilus]PAE09361.1 transcriptional regulator LytR [Terribacillus saccharophilus]
MVLGRKEKRKKKRTWLKVTLSIIVVLIIAVAATGIYAANKAKSTVNTMQKNSDSIDKKQSITKVKDQEKLNVLLLGVDQREDDAGRSDALMVMSLDPSNDSMKLISIPRDSRTEIVGHGTTDKINHAYAFGGVDMAIDTVENFLDTDIDYFAEMNMEGLSDFVDAVGGITVNNQLDWIDEGYYEKGYHYAQGEIQLDGPKAMGYVRMRHLDPDGDFGRNARQRQVIQAVIDKGASINSVSKIDDILGALGNNVETNMDFSTMTDLFKNYRNVRQNSENYQMQGTGTTIDKVYYYEVSQEERDKVHDMIS